MNGIEFMLVTENFHEETDRDREEDEKTGLVEKQRVAFEERGFGLKERLNLRRVREVEKSAIETADQVRFLEKLAVIHQ